MKRYWDLPENERAELTYEQVEAMLAVELMEKGVVKIDPPTLLPVEFPEIPTKTVWVIKRSYSQSDVAYENADVAAAAMKGALWLENHWNGSETTYSIKRDCMKVEGIEAAEASDMAASKSQRDQASANKKANKTAQTDYDDACRAAHEAVEGVWDDYRDCQRKASRYRKIVATFDEYVTLCDGNKGTAAKFLKKTYPSETAEAFDWLGLDMPFNAFEPLAIAAEEAETADV